MLHSVIRSSGGELNEPAGPSGRKETRRGDLPGIVVAVKSRRLRAAAKRSGRGPEAVAIDRAIRHNLRDERARRRSDRTATDN
jgi:hypothetical protein